MERVLLLNADEWTPLSIISWKKAIELICQEKVKVIEETDQEVRSVSIAIKVPSIIALKKYVRFKRKIKYSKYNVFARDDYKCQYCGKEIERGCEMTLDHVNPRSQGGTTCWENTVLACRSCNFKKGGRTPKEAHMRLMKQPIKPEFLNWLTVTFKRSSNMPDEWLAYYKIE